ncbi:MAG TPA: hypothetical protein VKS60_20560 [Stellaceae bacterium]|nr:hypothetical protein [Stellaceae bacterium]
MSLMYLITFASDAVANRSEIDALDDALTRMPGVVHALIHLPVAAASSATYVNADPTPALALQIYFADINALEAACGRGGAMGGLPEHVPSLARTEIRHQAMLARHFAVPDPVFRTPVGELPVCNLVTYPGPAEDERIWLAYYLVIHAPIMARQPGIRELEISMRIDWVDDLPWRRMNVMQANKVVFDSAEALDASHDSPVMTELREDYAMFPPFRGGNSHFAMRTRTVRLPGLAASPRGLDASLASPGPMAEARGGEGGDVR